MTRYLSASLLLLAGCATVYDFDQRAPDARYSSTRQATELTQCISAAVARLGRVSVDRGESTSVITLRRENGYAVARITVRPTQSGSTVAVRQAISYSLGTTIQNCL
jgi:hypothetical protein